MCKKVPVDFKFRGHYHLDVDIPPEPSGINWENYKTTFCSRFFFSIVLALILSSLLVASILLTYSIKEIFDSINYSTYCPKQYLYAKEENVRTDAEIQFINNCFC